MIGHIYGDNQKPTEIGSRSPSNKIDKDGASGDEWTKDYVKKGDLTDKSLEMKNCFARMFGRGVLLGTVVSLLGGSAGLAFLGYNVAMAAGIAPIIGIAGGVAAAVGFIFKRDANKYGKKELIVNNQVQEKTYFAGMEPMSRQELNAKISTEQGTKKETDQKFVLNSKEMDKIMQGLEKVDDEKIESFADCKKQLIGLEKDRRLLGYVGLKTLGGNKVLSLITAVDAVNFLASGKGISVANAGEGKNSGYDYEVSVKRADMRSHRKDDGHRNITSTDYELREIKGKEELEKVSDGKGLPPGVVGVDPKNNKLVTSDGFKIVGHSLHYEFNDSLGLVVRTERDSTHTKNVT
jgi:hypothetical protein